MRTASRPITLLLPFLALLVVLAASPQRLDASTMGFKFNKGICALGPAPVGQNWLSLPFSNIYTNAANVCTALGLTAGAGTVMQINASLGVPIIYSCGDAAPFTINPRVGLIVTNPVATSGVIVGSHAPGPPGTDLFSIGPQPVGFNLFPVPYNSMAATARDLCGQLGLAGTPAIITRTVACMGIPITHFCTDFGPGFNLAVTEAVLIQTPGPPIIGFDPPHF